MAPTKRPPMDFRSWSTETGKEMYGWILAKCESGFGTRTTARTLAITGVLSRSAYICGTTTGCLEKRRREAKSKASAHPLCLRLKSPSFRACARTDHPGLS